jgi:DNA-binding IscR family transcriptional regulator
MFSSTVEYALRAVTWMAGRPDEAMTAQRIAAATSMPEDYLSKVLQQLARASLKTLKTSRCSTSSMPSSRSSASASAR